MKVFEFNDHFKSYFVTAERMEDARALALQHSRNARDLFLVDDAELDEQPRVIFIKQECDQCS